MLSADAGAQAHPGDRAERACTVDRGRERASELVRKPFALRDAGRQHPARAPGRPPAPRRLVAPRRLARAPPRMGRASGANVAPTAPWIPNVCKRSWRRCAPNALPIAEALQQLRELPFRDARVRARRHPPPPAHRLSRGRVRRGQDARADRRHPGRAREGRLDRARDARQPGGRRDRRRPCAGGALPAGAARDRGRADAGARPRARADRRRQRRDRRHPGRRGGGADRRARRQPRRIGCSTSASRGCTACSRTAPRSSRPR